MSWWAWLALTGTGGIVALWAYLVFGSLEYAMRTPPDDDLHTDGATDE